QLDSESVIVAAGIAEQHRRAAIGRDQQIEISVIINVCISSATCQPRGVECRAHAGRYFLKPALAAIAKQVWRLPVFDALLDFFNVALDMSISDKDVRP